MKKFTLLTALLLLVGGVANMWAQFSAQEISAPVADATTETEVQTPAPAAATTAATDSAVMPTKGKFYHISCATYDSNSKTYVLRYLVVENGAIKTTTDLKKGNVNHQWLCDTVNGKVTFKNGSGKYLAHVTTKNGLTLPDTAHEFEVKAKEPGKYEGAYSLYTGGSTNRYWCVKNDGSAFDQLQAPWDQTTQSHSSDFVFHEAMSIPNVGEQCYIYAITWNGSDLVNTYLYYNGSTLATSTACDRNSNNYKWTCEKTDTGYAFKNASGEIYLAHKATQATPYYFTVSTSSTYNFNAVNLYSINAKKYFLVKNNTGAFDQADKTYNPKSDGFTSDYRFEPVNASFDTNIRVAVNDPRVSATVTWNGTTKNTPATFTVAEGTAITSAAVTATSTNAAYKFVNFTENGKTSDTLSVASLTVDRSIVANFAPDIFSSKYGEKWICVDMSNNNGHAMNLPKADSYTDKAPNTALRNIADDSQLWCFVGTAESFKLYNKASGDQFILAYNGTPANGTVTKMVAASTTENTEWTLVSGLQHAVSGYCISPKSSNGWGLNPHGGAGKDLKFYTNGDQGNQWYFERISVNTLNKDVNGTSFEANRILGSINVTIDGNTTEVIIPVESTTASLNMVAGSTFSVKAHPREFHGYIFKGFKLEGSNELLDSITNVTDGTNITLVYEADATDKGQHMFYVSDSSSPFRIPSITRCGDGSLVLFSDHRPNGNDVGLGDVDIVSRYSTDNGKTWSEPQTILDGTGVSGALDCGFGDACSVGDANSMKVRMICAAGNTFIQSTNSESRNSIVSMVSEDGGKTWPKFDAAKHDISSKIYDIYKDCETPIAGAFFASGRIFQSRIIKVNEYYRLYAALYAKGSGNLVVYSDDFGDTWKPLGGANARPVPDGDEGKCEELPNGDILISSRKYYGRYFNVFSFTNIKAAEGTWGNQVNSGEQQGGISFGLDATNGELLLIKCKSTTAPAMTRNEALDKYVLLQSVPTKEGRKDLTIYYKEITADKYTSETAAANWKKGLLVCEGNSSYSAMTYQADGKIGIFYEEGYREGVEQVEYTMVYRALTLDETTNEEYTTSGYQFTSIDEVGTDNAPSVEGIYDINGRRVNSISEDGIYIVNGKKVMVRVK